MYQGARRKEMSKKPKKRGYFKELLRTHIQNNLKQYTVVLLFLLIGIIIGVIFVNNVSAEQGTEISGYLNNFITGQKGEKSIDQVSLLKQSLFDNISLAMLLWFVGSTVIGIPIVYGIVTYRGFCLGYAISSIIATIGTGKGMLLSISSMLLQNILCIPAILALAVSGIKLYQSIMKDKRKENIKLEIYRHTLFSLLLTGILIIASFIEVYISSNLLGFIIQYI